MTAVRRKGSSGEGVTAAYTAAVGPDVRSSVLAQLAWLKEAPTTALKARWRELFETEPPAYNRRFLESRLAYRIQELAYGGLKPETIKKLEQIAAQFETKGKAGKPARLDRKPIAGTVLIREWKGAEHCVTVRGDGYEYGGRPYQSLSAIARSITGTRWNGWSFFGLKNQRKSRS